MLDKSIPYKNIIMKASPEAIASIDVAPLPDGFSFRPYREGDEHHWARIETAVLEFDAEEKALEYFTRVFLPFPEELKKRYAFVTAPDGLPVAAAAAWFGDNNPAGQAVLQWVSAHPDYQGKGLGRAVVTKALSLFPSLHPGQAVYLHTQTWSHPAIRLYYSLGFRMTRTETSPKLKGIEEETEMHRNDFAEAIEVLGEVYSPELVAALRDSAV